MSTSIFRSDLDQGKYQVDRNILSVFRPQTRKPTEIEQGMSSNEISDVVSDNIIAVVKKQFKEAKKDFKSQTKNEK